MTREELIAALERAEGPSRELDTEIHALLGLPEPVSVPSTTVDGAETAIVLGGPRKYTHSLDAALTLVPEGWRVAALQETWRPTDGRPTSWRAVLMVRGGKATGNEEVDDLAWCPTPSIALCLAALKARAT